MVGTLTPNGNVLADEGAPKGALAVELAAAGWELEAAALGFWNGFEVELTKGLGAKPVVAV